MSTGYNRARRHRFAIGAGRLARQTGPFRDGLDHRDWPLTAVVMIVRESFDNGRARFAFSCPVLMECLVRLMEFLAGKLADQFGSDNSAAGLCQRRDGLV